MKNRVSKIIAICLCVAILASGTVYAFNSNKDVKKEEATADEQTTEAVKEGEDVYKDETVYVLANADGTVQKIIVSDWIKNNLSLDKITDVTQLENIENVKGDESYTLGGDNTYVWDAKGNDIYYQGTIEKELPVNISVSYKLDGKSISPYELVGKSGKVTIRFNYENKKYETVNINGEDKAIYVPFVMLTGVLLDNDTFTNVQVSNGKIINDGDRTAVVGFALPGLQESLGIDGKKLEIPSYVEITADVTNFSLGNTVTVATNSLFNEVDTEDINSLSDLTDSIDQLKDVMAKLLDGSSALYDGLCMLLDKSTELVDGIYQLAEGAEKLKDGAYVLNQGAEKLYGGIDELSKGLNELSANNDKLVGGAKQVFESLLSTATAQLNSAGISVEPLTIDNYASVLNGIIDSLDTAKIYDKALGQVTAAVEQKRDYIRSQVISAIKQEVEASVTSLVREQVIEQVTKAVREELLSQVAETIRENVESQVIASATGMDRTSYYKAVSAGYVDKGTQSAIAKAIDEKMESKEIQGLISSKVDEQMKTEKVNTTIGQKVDEQMKSQKIKSTISTKVNEKMAEDDIKSLIEQNTELQVQKIISEQMASEEVQSKLSQASEGAKSVISLKTSLDDYNAFYLGLISYTSGVAQAASGASSLKNGADQLKSGTYSLYDGICSLYDGILTMKDGSPALISGITQLRDGAMQLSDGLSQFNEKGVEKLMGVVGDAEEFIDRFKAVVKVSKNYKSFAGSSQDGNVKFIYRTEEIK